MLPKKGKGKLPGDGEWVIPFYDIYNSAHLNKLCPNKNIKFSLKVIYFRQKSFFASDHSHFKNHAIGTKISSTEYISNRAVITYSQTYNSKKSQTYKKIRPKFGKKRDQDNRNKKSKQLSQQVH